MHDARTDVWRGAADQLKVLDDAGKIRECHGS